MKKLFKWTGIGIGLLLVITISLIIVIMISYDRYGNYSYGGILSENQAKFDVTYYELNLEIFPSDQAIKGSNSIKLRVLSDALDKIELDLIDNFEVEKVLDQDKNALVFRHDDDKLWVVLKSIPQQNEIISFRVYYQGHPVEAILPPWIGGFSWSTDSTGKDWIGVTCQGEGAKIWFPCKDHPSDRPDSAALNITVPDSLFCAANGILQKTSVPEAGKKTFHWITRYPINNYNININIGNYRILPEKYVTLQGDTMPVYFYVLPQSLKGARKHLKMAVDMLYTYRKFYGEYPFTKEKFAIVETPYLGMEHQTINAYGNKYRYTTVNDKEYDWLMLHEMGHEWWGNKLSITDLADMWIHEGICTYGEALYQLDKNGEQAYHDYMQKLKKRIENKIPVIPKRNADSQESYHTDIYFKGAWMMHSLRYLTGDSVFFDILSTFVNDSAYIYANLTCTEDLIQLVEQKAGKNVTPFIRSFLTTTDLPVFIVDSLGADQYNIGIQNVDYSLPVQIVIDENIKKLILDRKPVLIRTNKRPALDPEDWILEAGELQ